MKLTLELTVQETITLIEVSDLIAEIEGITDTDDCTLVTVATLVAVDGMPVSRLIPKTLKDFVKEGKKDGDAS